MNHKIEIGELIAQAIAHPDVKTAIESRARARLSKAQYLAYKAGRLRFGDNLRVETGVRSGAKAKSGLKRPFARVTSTTTEEEQAADNRSASLSRTQILRRAAK